MLRDWLAVSWDALLSLSDAIGGTRFGLVREDDSPGEPLCAISRLM